MKMDDWQYETVPDLDQSFAERLRGFPREPEMGVYALRSAATLALRSWLAIYHRFRVEGRHHLPASGSFIMVANHCSHLDTPCLISSLPWRQIHKTFPAAAADYFFSSLPRSVFSAIFINALPFERNLTGGQSLAVCAELLNAPDNVLVLFPEGTRSTNGEIGRFRSGVGRLVVGRDTPVVPCYLDGAFRAWPKGGLWPRPRRLRLKIGKPRLYADRKECREAVQEVVKELRADVERLSESRRR